MNIRIKRFDTDLPLPEHKTDGASAFDLQAREEVTIAAHEVGYVPLNVAIATPADHFLLLAARSGLHKKGLMFANGIGVGDSDFAGDDDEYQAALFNFTDQSVTIERGQRISQGIFVKKSVFRWEEVTSMQNPTRGGFGSTGDS